jgi:uncharacterized protein (TIGR03067 family)
MRLLVLAVCVGLITDGSAQQPEQKAKADPKQKPDLELIQGTWLIVGLETGGKAEAERNYRGNTFTFTRDKATLREGTFPAIDFALSLDPSRTPRAIDLTAKGNLLKGIYKLDGDEMTLCIGIGGLRPTEFATKGGGDSETFTLKRSNWEHYTNKPVGFSVDLPGKPAEKAVDVTITSGTVATTFQTFHNETDRLTYLVSVTPLPGKLDAKELDAAFEAVKKAVIVELVDKAKVTPETDREFRSNGYAGKEWTLGFEAPDSKETMAMRIRLFIAGDRLYALAVSGMEDGTKSPNVTRFWNSFKLPAEKR